MSAIAVRSTFVTTLAWIFIGLSAFACLITLAQNLMLQALLEPAMAQLDPPPGIPAPFAWMTAHMAWFFRAALAASAATLTASIGLLLRWNWARRLFIALLALAILSQIGGLAFQWWMFDNAGDLMASAKAPDDFTQGMQVMLAVIRIVGAALAVALAGLSGWLIIRLRRPAVREEFGARRG
jgi:hypothetical protein